MNEHDFEEPETIAVVGLAGRYPESPDIDELWETFRTGRDCLRTFSPEEMKERGVPAEYFERKNFVSRGTAMPDVDAFDAAFFGFTPREAAVMDPQSRIFLETCYEALENSGTDPFRYPEAIGVFAGSNPNDYAALLGVADPSDSLAAFDQLIGSDKDFLATRVSHRLNLRGPALTLQTACSTSLVAIHLAAQSLLNYECSMALAGGVTVNFRQGVGYFYQQGMILSPEGTCRAFDADAEGTTLGQGCGVVVLKRLSEAIEDGDHIWAVLKSSATNNDGASKISYTAPSEDGQAEVIALAHELAGVSADSISLIEAHGTGTKLGDPVEIAALTRAFAHGTDRKQFCAIGSAKTNLGHTDAAAGVTGFIKAVLALANRQLPPSIHFDAPNPDIGFDQTPFYVNTQLREWEVDDYPLRAGVSAFGIGGTNAHVVLEEAPVRPVEKSPSRSKHILVFSGRSANGADALVDRVVGRLPETGDALVDVAHTLRNGRAMHSHRRAMVVDDGLDRGSIPEVSKVSGVALDSAGASVWLYTGQGSQYAGMAADLDANEPAFAAAIDECVQTLEPLLGVDVRELLFSQDDGADERLRQTAFTQPALFTIEYATSRLLASWGLRPDIVIGHSIGEFAAAVEAGIISLEAGLRLVVERGRLMQSMEPGSMASIEIERENLDELLAQWRSVSLAADNGGDRLVVSGPTADIESLVAQCEASGRATSILRTSHAFHSVMMDDAADQFERFAAGFEFSAPNVPFVSNVTGTWITDDQATSAAFWADQIRKPVRFAECVSAVADRGPVFVEVGPGSTLSTMAIRNEMIESGTAASVNIIRHPRVSRNDQDVALEAMARLWCAGVDLDWVALGQDGGRTVPLPSYPFDRTEAWLPNIRHQLSLPAFGHTSASSGPSVERRDVEDWLYASSMQRLPALGSTAAYEPDGVLAFVRDDPGGAAALDALRSRFGSVIAVQPGAEFAVLDGSTYVANPSDDAQISQVFEQLKERDIDFNLVVHGWALGADQHIEFDQLDRVLDLGVHSAHAIARELSRTNREQRLAFLVTGARRVFDSDSVHAPAALLEGPAKVIPLEYAQTSTLLIDLEQNWDTDGAHEVLVRELVGPFEGPLISLRGRDRWAPTVVPTGGFDEAQPLRPAGHYLVVGGLGGVGLSIAKFLAEEYGANLSLTSRNGRPSFDEAASLERRERLERLHEVEALSPHCEVFAADAADRDSMRSVVERAEALGGPINGVIVAAGVADSAGIIHRRTRESMVDSVKSKVHGSVVLAEVLQDRDLDFVLFSSSVAATLYHNRFAQVGYVTGNAFVEAFADECRQRGLPARTVAWDDWLEIGMSVRAAEQFSDTYGHDVTLMDELNSFTPQEGVRVFCQALTTTAPVVVVSPTDLLRRIGEDVNTVSPFLEQATGGGDISAGDDLDLCVPTLDSVGALWCELLGYSEVASTDDFFVLGGDSLQVARMGDTLSRNLGIEVPIDTLFDNSQLSAMVSALEALVLTEPDEAVVEVDQGEIPLSPAQIRFLSRQSPNPDHFNVSVALDPDTPVDPDVVSEAVRALVERHPVLRTTFPEQGRQLVNDPESWTGVELVSITSLDDLESVGTDLQTGLNLAEGPVFRLAVVSVESTSEQRLLMVIHHMVSDRLSLLLAVDNLAEEIVRLESGLDTSRQATASFGSWIRELQDFAQSEEALAVADGWQGLPSGEVQPIPVDFGETLNRNVDADAVSLVMDTKLLNSSEARIDEVLLVGLGRAVSEWSQAKYGLIETLNHGRRTNRVEVSRTLGFFLTYSPVLIQHDLPLVESVADLRGQLETAWAYDPLRFYAPPELSQQAQVLGGAEVLFNFVGKAITDSTSDARLRVTQDRRGPESDPDGVRAHKVAVMAEVRDDETVEVRFVYSRKLHSKDSIDALSQRFVSTVRALQEVES